MIEKQRSLRRFRINKDIMRKCGFNKEVDLVEKGICPFCKKQVDTATFRDKISKREFKISGLCQEYQDKTFEEKGAEQ